MKKTSNLKICMRLITLVKPLSIHMILAIIMGVVGFLCATFITVLGGYAILEILDITNIVTLKTIFFIIVIIAISRGILHYAEQALNHFIAFKILAILRDKLFKSLRRLCPAKLEVKDKGNLILMITSDIELLEVFYAHTISPIAIAVLMSIIMSAFISTFHISLGIVAILAYAMVGVVVPYIITKINGKNGDVFRDKSGDLSSYILESLRGIDEIISFSAGNKRLYNISKKTDDISIYERKMKQNMGINTAITNTIILTFDILILMLSAFLYTQNIIGIDGVIISTIAMMSSFGPVVALANLGSTLQNTFAAGRRVIDILDEQPMVLDVCGNEKIEFSDIKANNISFSYGNDNILKDFSVEIPQNKTIGIVGQSGSGKSTFLRLLMRFWNVDSGEISINGHNINKINTCELRDMQSFVTQETHLFKDSIENNIKIAKLDATKEEVIEACKKASIHEFIAKLPYGYDTNVGELGDTLSGGEKQRIGLARAFLHDSELLILDEPTSNLDSLNEAEILKSISLEKNKKTIILVSHRKSTMKIADKTYSVFSGRMS